MAFQISVRQLVLLGLSVLAPAVCSAQASKVSKEAPSESGAFITKLGSDTIAVEQYSRSGNRIVGDLIVRSPSTRVSHYVVDLDKSGVPARFEYSTRSPDGSLLPNTAVGLTLQFGNDSVKREIKWPDSTQTRSIANAQNAIPFMPSSIITYQIGTQWMRTARRDTADLKLLQLGAAQPLVQATKINGNKARVNYFGNFPLYFTIDKAGRILGADGSQTTIKILATRVASVDIPKLAKGFAALGTPSPRDTARGTVGAAHLLVDYGRPSTRGRNVWVNGVLGDTLWRTGANAATQFTTDADLVVAGQTVPAGTYTLWTHTKPDASYELVFNRQTKQWGTEYHPDQDLVRVPLTRSALPTSIDKFTIAIEPLGSTSSLKIMWGNQALWVPVAPK